MKILFSILIFAFSSFPIFAQKRPMTLAVIEPKLDSIQEQQDILYRYTIVNRTAAKMANEKFGREILASEIIVYPKSDTLIAVVAPIDGQKIYEAHFMDQFDKVAWDTSRNRSLSEAEKKLFALKDTLLQQSKNEKYNVRFPEGFGLNYTLFPAKNGYHFYVLTTTEEENLIPFGNAYVFISDENGHVNSFKKIYPEFDPVSTIGPRGNALFMIMPPYPVEEPFIHAADICNFRIYGVPAGVKKLGVYSIRNKRTTYYDPKSNELGFEP